MRSDTVQSTKMDPVCITDFEDLARSKLSKGIFDYYSSGANEEQTLDENRKAFSRLKLRPRVLRGIKEPDMRTSLLGHVISMPICIAPTAMQKMAHPDGEVGTARAAAATDTCMVLSFGSNISFEDLARAVPEGLKWFHVDLLKDRNVMASLIRRAKHAGYKAVVMAVDAPAPGRKVRSMKSQFTFPADLPSANNLDLTVPASALDRDPEFRWTDVSWVKSNTELPIVLKGIMTEEDAVMAVEAGADAIIVSNHGGRQLDGVPATIDVLPEVVKAVDGRIEVYLDGGIRLGTDVLKALALGARAVFIGRPVIWGLVYQGEKGVKEVLKMLQEELKLAMILSGQPSVGDVGRSLLWRPI